MKESKYDQESIDKMAEEMAKVTHWVSYGPKYTTEPCDPELWERFRKVKRWFIDDS